MQRDYSEAQLEVLGLSIDRTAKDRYRDYKYKVHCHFKREGAEIPYKEMSDEDWVKCIYLFSSDKFRVSTIFTYYSSYKYFCFANFSNAWLFFFFNHRSVLKKRNKSNREKSKYPSLHRTRTYVVARHTKVKFQYHIINCYLHIIDIYKYY